MMDRRAFTARLGLAAAAWLHPRLALARDTPGAGKATTARNIVLLHGLFADGSCWS